MPFPAPEGTELVELIAAGTVFLVALVRRGGEAVVCKRLVPRVRDEHAGRAAMAREGLFLSRARHPAVPALLGVGSDAYGPFVLESRVPGVTARGLVEAWRARGAGVPPSLVAHVAAAAAEALADLHERAGEGGPLGLSHGDLSPDHVVLGPIGDVRFVDFGAARFAGMDASLETDDKGTLPFAAPEVARGEARPGQAADVYALAIHLAPGGPLCPARDEAAMLLAIGERGLPASLADQAAGLPEAAREALRRAIALDPGSRLSSARALANAISGGSDHRERRGEAPARNSR
jgi:serine/threonine-protein kinase